MSTTQNALEVAKAKLDVLDQVAKVVNLGHTAETAITLIRYLISTITGPEVTADSIRRELEEIKKGIAANDREADTALDKKFPT